MKNCDCLKKIKRTLEAESTDSKISIDSYISADRGLECFPVVTSCYQSRKGNGEEILKPLKLKYCPWCGKEYDYEPCSKFGGQE